MRAVVTAMAALLLAMPAAAQHEGHGTGGGMPAGWQGRLDRPNLNIADVKMMGMGDRLHITTGPHVILWRPEQVARGVYTLNATFTQSKAPERLEGFGILAGGRNLNEDNQDYLYFLARHDGSYMIRHRAGSEVHTLAPWTKHEAVRQAGASSAATNTLAIESRANDVRFLVNGVVVQTIDRVPMLNTDGIAGLRIGHHMDVMVSNFTATPAAR